MHAIKIIGLLLVTSSSAFGQTVLTADTEAMDQRARAEIEARFEGVQPDDRVLKSVTWTKPSRNQPVAL